MTDSSQQARQALANTRFTTYWLDSLDSVEDTPSLSGVIGCDLLIVHIED